MPELVAALDEAAGRLVSCTRPFSFPVLADMVCNTLLGKSSGRDAFTAERGKAWDKLLVVECNNHGHAVLQALERARSDRPIRAMGLWLVALMTASGIGLALVLRRWVRQPSTSSNSSAPLVPPTRDEFDDRLDAELAELD